ncbi:VSIG1 protein, partial [Amia calva]|nr:VSIG1 protein [Amia calva]
MFVLQFYYYQGGQSAVTGQFTGRVTAVPGATNASITISNMQPSDTGSYTCTVNNMDDMNGQNQGSIFVSVFVKPSKPYCAVHGSVELGHLVSLICKSEEGIPAPTYTWHKLDQGTTRSALGQMNTQSGILSIGNLSQFEFGQYQCNSSNSLGVATCTVELSEVHDGAIAGAVIGAILGAALIALIVWIVAHNVRRRKYNAKQGATTEMK